MSDQYYTRVHVLNYKMHIWQCIRCGESFLAGRDKGQILVIYNFKHN